MQRAPKKRLSVIPFHEVRKILDEMTTHRDPDDGRFACPTCSRKFKFERAKVKRHLTQHLGSEHLPYTCTLCQLKSVAREDIRRHVIDVHKADFTESMEVECTDADKEHVLKEL